MLGLPTQLWTIILFVVPGAIFLPVGANLVVKASIEIAVDLGVTDTVVGLTILAFGTSLPELATTVSAARQKRTEVAVGTVIGSNIFNILAIMGVAAAVSPATVLVPRGFLTLDIPVMIGAALLISAFVWLRRPIGRTAGTMFLTAYIAYLIALVLRTMATA